MKQLHVRFPQGNGGWWLKHLIQSLELNRYIQNDDSHYHKFSNGIELSHSLTPVEPKEIVFGGTYYFNMFANYAKKTNFEIAVLVNDQYTTNICQASYLLEFQHIDADLLSDSVYANNYDNFRDSLFSTLDNLNVEYHKNDQLCRTLFNEYRDKLADPCELFNQWDNMHWIYWCMGVTKKELSEFPDDAPINALVDWLTPHKKFVADYTEQRMYKK